VPFGSLSRRLAIGVFLAKGHMAAGACKIVHALSEKAFHVRRIEDDTIKALVLIRETSAVNTCAYVGGEESVSTRRHIAPKDARAVGDIRHRRALRHMQFQNQGEHVRVSRDMSGQNEIRCRDAALDSACFAGAVATWRFHRAEKVTLDLDLLSRARNAPRNTVWFGL